MKVSMEDLGEAPGIAEIAEDLLPPSSARAGERSEVQGLVEIEPQTLMEAADAEGIPPAVVDKALVEASRAGEFPYIGESGVASVAKLYWFLDSDRQRLPPQEFTVPWFASHAPHGGTVQVRHTTKRTRSGNFGLDIYGTTIGMRRRMEVTVTDDSTPMGFCTSHLVVFRGTPCRWGPSEDWQFEDVVHLGETEEPMDPCPLCSIHPGQIDRAAYVTEPYVDRRRMPAPETRSKTFDWGKGFTFGVRIPLPGLGPGDGANIGFSLQSSVIWDVSWLFQGGFLYQAYRHRETPDKFLPMWAYE
jgi:hypothetical protein